MTGEGQDRRGERAVTGGKPRIDPSLRVDLALTEGTGVLYVLRRSRWRRYVTIGSPEELR